jgi:hypothetical protein
VATDCTRPAEPRHHLLPEHRRDLEPVEPVEDAARLLRVDEPLVDVPRLREGPLDRVFRDLVEHHATHRDLRLEHLAQVPGDRLALAVLVGREQELVRGSELLPEVRHDTLLVGVEDVERLEPVLDVHAERAEPRLVALLDVRRPLRQVADVADARLHDEVAAEIAGDRARLGGRFDDDETWHGRDRVTSGFAAASLPTARILRADAAPPEAQRPLPPHRRGQLAPLANRVSPSLDGA